MAESLLSCFNATGIGDIVAFIPNNNSSAPTGYSIASVGGRQAIKGTGGASELTMTNIPQVSPAASDFTFHVGDVYVDGSLAAGVNRALVRLPDETSYLHWVQVSASTYKFAAYTSGGTQLGLGSTVFNTASWHTYRFVYSGSGDTIEVWIDGILEFTLTGRTATAFSVISLVQAEAADGYTHAWSKGYKSYSSLASDRPHNTNWEVVTIHPASDNDSATYGNDNTLCQDGAGSFAEWGEWTGGATVNDGATTMNVLCGGTSAKEISLLGTAAVTAGYNVAGATELTVSQAAAGSKTVDWWQILKDTVGGTETEQQMNNLAAAFATYRRSVSAPPAGVWSDYIASNTFNHASASKKLGAGVRSVSTNGANDDHTALAVQIALSQNDPPATENRRRLLAQVI